MGCNVTKATSQNQPVFSLYSIQVRNASQKDIFIISFQSSI
nr:MAG TPA: hypothetical protein [Caudoviricetes sp.]